MMGMKWPSFAEATESTVTKNEYKCLSSSYEFYLQSGDIAFYIVVTSCLNLVILIKH